MVLLMCYKLRFPESVSQPFLNLEWAEVERQDIREPTVEIVQIQACELE